MYVCKCLCIARDGKRPRRGQAQEVPSGPAALRGMADGRPRKAKPSAKLGDLRPDGIIAPTAYLALCGMCHGGQSDEDIASPEVCSNKQTTVLHPAPCGVAEPHHVFAESSAPTHAGRPTGHVVGRMWRELARQWAINASRLALGRARRISFHPSGAQAVGREELAHSPARVCMQSRIDAHTRISEGVFVMILRWRASDRS